MRAVTGVIGPEDLVQKACLMAEDFPELELRPLPYAEETEVLTLFLEHLDIIDIAFFTGNWPYHYVVEHLGSQLTKPVVYVSSHTGSSLHKTLAQMLYHGIDIRHISVDTLPASEIREAYGEIGLAADDVHTLEITSAIPRERLVDFHLELWRKGKTRAAVTFMRTAYLALTGLGVPVFRCTPGIHATREALFRAVLEARALRMKAAQIAVGLCRLSDPPEQSTLPTSELNQMRLKLLQVLFDFARELAASVHPVQGNDFLLFTTRGALEQVTGSFRSLPVLQTIAEAIPVSVAFGFGVGTTAELSQKYATMALDLAVRQGDNCAFVCFDDGRQVGPIGHPRCLAYSIRAEPALAEACAKAHLKTATLNRLQGVLQRSRSDLTTATRLAVDLGVTPRNARRILERLSRAGLAEVVQTEQALRGRPSKVFRVELRPGGKSSPTSHPPVGAGITRPS